MSKNWSVSGLLLLSLVSTYEFSRAEETPTSASTTSSVNGVKDAVGYVRVGREQHLVYKTDTENTYLYEQAYDLDSQIPDGQDFVTFAVTPHVLTAAEKDSFLQGKTATLIPFVRTGDPKVEVYSSQGEKLPASVPIVGSSTIILSVKKAVLSDKPLQSIEDLGKVGVIVTVIDHYRLNRSNTAESRIDLSKTVASNLKERATGKVIREKGMELLHGVNDLDNVFVEQDILQSQNFDILAELSVILSGYKELDEIIKAQIQTLTKSSLEDMTTAKAISTLNESTNSAFVIDTDLGRQELTPDTFESAINEYNSQDESVSRTAKLQQIASILQTEDKDAESWYNHVLKKTTQASQSDASIDVFDVLGAAGNSSNNQTSEFSSLSEGTKESIKKRFQSFNSQNKEDIYSSLKRMVSFKGNQHILKRNPKSLNFRRIALNSISNITSIHVSKRVSSIEYLAPHRSILTTLVSAELLKIRELEVLNSISGRQYISFDRLQNDTFSIRLDLPANFSPAQMLYELGSIKPTISQFTLNVHPESNIDDADVDTFIRRRGKSLERIIINGGNRLGSRTVNAALSDSREMVGLHSMRLQGKPVFVGQKVTIRELSFGSGFGDVQIQSIVSALSADLQSFSSSGSEVNNLSVDELSKCENLKSVAFAFDPVYWNAEFLTQWKLPVCESISLHLEPRDIGTRVDTLKVIDFKGMPKLKTLSISRNYGN